MPRPRLLKDRPMTPYERQKRVRANQRAQMEQMRSALVRIATSHAIAEARAIARKALAVDEVDSRYVAPDQTGNSVT